MPISPTIRILCLALLTALLSIQGSSKSVVAQPTDLRGAGSYHDWLLETLASQHGLPQIERDSGWLLPADEAATLSALYVYNAARQEIAVADQPFERAVRVRVDEALPLVWDSGAAIDVVSEQAGERAGEAADEIEPGAALLLTFWVRSVAAEAGGGALRVRLEDRETYHASLSEWIVPTADWQQIWLRTTLPAAADGATASNGVQIAWALAAQAQTLDIGGLALLRYEGPLADLPQTGRDRYPGQASDAPWRAAAQQQIQAVRQADLTVHVVDAAGWPVPNADVHVAMQRHAFGFGTAVRVNALQETPLLGEADRALYRQRLLDLDGRGHGFNVAIIENGLKWTTWEADDWTTQADTAGALAWLRAQGLRVRGHNLLWGSWDELPADLFARRDDLAYVEARVRGRIAETLGHESLHGALFEWDVINEPRLERELANLFIGPTFPSGDEIYADWFALAQQSDPAARLFLNDYGILSEGGLLVGQQNAYHDLIELLDARDAPLGGIGFQSHMSYPLSAPERILAVLDEFARHGQPLVITEYDIELAGNELAGEAIDDPAALARREAVAADYLRDFLTVSFSHPAVTGFHLWGFWDGQHWLGDAPLYRDDWSLKPSGEAYIDLVFDQWWTDERGRTDGEGRLTTRGFLGDYLITVRAENNGEDSGDDAAADLVQTVSTELAASGRQITITLGPAQPPAPRTSVRLPMIMR